MEKILNCQGGQFFPEIYESGLLADVADSLGLNPRAIVAFGGKVGTLYGETVLALPICCLDEGCFWPFSVRLTGWHATRDGDFWFTIPATGGGKPRGFVGTWGRLLSTDCRLVNVCLSLLDAMMATRLDPDAGCFYFPREPDIDDFWFLSALSGREVRVIFPPFRVNLAWGRAWLRFLREVGEPRAVPLPRATLAESVEMKGITA